MTDLSFRIGHGYDIHPLVVGYPLILGGNEIPFDKGLKGHSDGDVLTHAVIDALLGALSLGDIGQHFPNTDESLRGANSLNLLRQSNLLITEKGYSIANIDTTIICQEPKLAQHYPVMKGNLAAHLNLDTTQISIKAKTKEQLGDVGEGHAIEAYAIALLHRN